MTWAKDAPNPGSREAGDQGCICAVMDNNHGERAPWGKHGWWITGGCPLHDSITGQCRIWMRTLARLIPG